MGKRREMGQRNGIEEHGGESGGEVAGSDSNGVECTCNPDEGSWRGNSVAKLVIVGKVVRV